MKFERTVKNRRIITRENLVEYLQKHGLIYMDNGRADVVYARVSTHKQRERGNLDRQAETVATFASTKNPQNLEIITEVGSGLNDNRRELRKLLKRIVNKEIGRVFVNYKDRLTRFGYNYILDVCKEVGTEIVIVSSEIKEKSIQEELAEDLCSIIHSFSGKLYGLRNGKIEKKLNKVKEMGVQTV